MNNKTRPDLLQITTQGIKGGNAKTERKGQCLITVTKGFNEPQYNISVDVYTGSGNNYKPRENALLNIHFPDGQLFSGTFEDLQSLINQ